MNTQTTTDKAAKMLDNDLPSTLRAEIEQLTAQVETLSRDLSRLGKTSLRTARRGAAQGAEALTRTGEDVSEQVGRELARVEERLVTEVNDRPLRALAIAAGAGALLALFLRR